MNVNPSTGMWTGTDLALSLRVHLEYLSAPAFLVCLHRSNPSRVMYFLMITGGKGKGGVSKHNLPLFPLSSVYDISEGGHFPMSQNTHF